MGTVCLKLFTTGIKFVQWPLNIDQSVCIWCWLVYRLCISTVTRNSLLEMAMNYSRRLQVLSVCKTCKLLSLLQSKRLLFTHLLKGRQSSRFILIATPCKVPLLHVNKETKLPCCFTMGKPRGSNSRDFLSTAKNQGGVL